MRRQQVLQCQHMAQTSSTGQCSPRFRILKCSLWVVIALLIVIGILALPLGCTTVIVPPANPPHPAQVYLLDYGYTSGLVLSTADGGAVKYVYGDWDYYALRRNDLWHGIAALFWPTQGALGRNVLPGSVSPEQVANYYAANVQHAYVITVDKAAALELADDLNALYEQYIDTEVVNIAYGLTFVHHPRRYTYFWNSNHAVASWLEALDCDVRGPAYHSSWRIEQPARSVDAD